MQSRENGHSFDVLTSNEIAALIKEPKEISPKARSNRFKLQDQHRRYSLYLISLTNPESMYHVFMNQNVNNTDNFSIGLRFRKSSHHVFVTLTRYNGPHRTFEEYPGDHHVKPHKHYVTPDELSLGILEPKPGRIEITSEYCTFDEATRVFYTNICVVNDYIDFVPEELRYGVWVNGSE